MIIDINLRDIEGVVLVIYVLSVIVNNRLLVIILILIIIKYINNNIGKYYLLDKYGYHYTPKQYFTDNPWKRDRDFFSFSKHRDFEKKSKNLNPRPSLRSESSKEKRQPPLCGWILSSPEGAHLK